MTAPTSSLPGGSWRVKRLWAVSRLLLATALVLVLLEGLLFAWSRALLAERRPDPALLSSAARPILCLGDSVTYGYPLRPDQAFPAVLARRLQEQGLTQFRVANLGLPGASTLDLWPMIDTELSSFSPSVRPLMLLMAGHNDIQEALKSTTRSATDDGQDAHASLTGLSYSPPFSWHELRVVRVGRWVLERLAPPPLPAVLDPQVLKRLHLHLTGAITRIQAHHATPVLLTYAVPGHAPPGLTPRQVEALEGMRSHQLQVNSMIRNVAQEQQVRLIDLERRVEVPGLWTSDAFVDVIHPSASTHEKIAAVIYRSLMVDGLMAVSEP